MSIRTFATTADLTALGPDHLLLGRREGGKEVRLVTLRHGDGNADCGALGVMADWLRHPAESAIARWGPLSVLASPLIVAVPGSRERAVDLLASTGVLETFFTDRTGWRPMERWDAEAAVDLLIQRGLISE